MVRIGFSDTPVASNDPRLLQDDVVFDFASQDVVLKNKRMHFSQLTDILDPETVNSLTSLSTAGLQNIVSAINEHFDNIDDKVEDLEEKDVFIDIQAFNENNADEKKRYFITKEG